MTDRRDLRSEIQRIRNRERLAIHRILYMTNTTILLVSQRSLIVSRTWLTFGVHREGDNDPAGFLRRNYCDSKPLCCEGIFH